VIAAKSRNADEKAWRWLKRSLGQRYYKAGVPGSSERVSFARECAGACRGRGGTPHAKYNLFDNVGFSHKRNIVIQSSMNLTKMGFLGQWNEAQVVYSAGVFDRFMRVYREARLNRPNASPYRRYPTGQVTSIFFPLLGANASRDPVMQSLDLARCTGATSGGTSAGRTRIRVIQYAIYEDRGLWLSKKLRALWNAGCDVQIIYALATKPVLSILRNRSGRGPIPMKQSVIKNRRGEIVKYNHSKWMTITGHYGSSRGAWITFTGSANWSNIAFTSDEQMELIANYPTARAHLLNFAKTWRQKTSRKPSFTGGGAEARTLPAGNYIPFGRGIYKYLNPYGD
jgi:phosphatidylserine/phosphatidylglycerophosphate/cardiolipin synthase-like enzyme